MLKKMKKTLLGITLATALATGNLINKANAQEPYENSNAYSMYANQDWNGYSGIYQEPTRKGKNNLLVYIITPSLLLGLGLNYWARSKMSKAEREKIDQLGAF